MVHFEKALKMFLASYIMRQSETGKHLPETKNTATPGLYPTISIMNVFLLVYLAVDKSLTVNTKH